MAIKSLGEIETFTLRELMALRDADAKRLREQWAKEKKEQADS